MKTIVVLGATSGIVIGTLNALVSTTTEYQFLLVGRDEKKLEVIKNDLVIRGAKRCEVFVSQLSEENSPKEVFEKAIKEFSGVDGIYLGYATLPDQKKAEQDVSYAIDSLKINFTSPIAHLNLWANYFEEKKAGQIAVITSVAGDRGRQSNYIYGCAKGGLIRYLQGLRNRLFASGVNVLDIRPGFVDTPMTSDIKKGPLFASSETAGRIIAKAMQNKKDVVYVPFFWFVILSIITAVPEAVFKRLKL